MTPGNASLSGDRPGERLPALVWIFASEPGHHRAAPAHTFEAAGAADDFPDGALDGRWLRG
jgi:hypothetical protein